VDAHRPEPVNGDVADDQLVQGLAVVPGNADVEIDRILVWVAAPPECGSDEMAYRIDLVPCPERTSEVGHRRTENEQRVAYRLLAHRVPLRQVQRAWLFL